MNLVLVLVLVRISSFEKPFPFRPFSICLKHFCIREVMQQRTRESDYGEVLPSAAPGEQPHPSHFAQPCLSPPLQPRQPLQGLPDL